MNCFQTLLSVSNGAPTRRSLLGSRGDEVVIDEIVFGEVVLDFVVTVPNFDLALAVLGILQEQESQGRTFAAFAGVAADAADAAAAAAADAAADAAAAGAGISLLFDAMVG